MGQEKEKNTQDEEYRFINETIKKKPLDKKKLIRKLAAITGSGILFGCCASAACVGMFPVFVEQFGMKNTEQDNLRIVTPFPKESEAKDSTYEEDQSTAENISLLDSYEAMYKDVLKVSENPRKALVTMKGLSQSQDMLDETQLSYNSSQGIIFLETDGEIYILSYGDEFHDIQNLEVTFGNGATAVAQICKEDDKTGLLVAQVEKSQLDQETIRSLYVVDFGAANTIPKNSTVIAIGCPAGDKDAVIYGMITSASGRIQMADTEYNILATNIHGQPDGSGVLLDIEGNVVGVIMKQEPNSTETVRAFPIAQLRPLIESMTNKKAVNYTGIYGTSITQAQSDRLHIPRGIYVDKVDGNSPAMAAGIQSGDIITKVDGAELKDMQSYYTLLQKKKAEDVMEITISRNISGGEGKYAELDFRVKIEER